MELESFAKYGDLLTRVIAGMIFILAGYGKLFAQPGIIGFSGMLSGIGFPASTFFAVLVGVIELAGGILLLLGVMTKYVCILLAIIMLVDIFSVHLADGWDGYRYQLLLLVVVIRYIGTSGSYDIFSCFRKK